MYDTPPGGLRGTASRVPSTTFSMARVCLLRQARGNAEGGHNALEARHEAHAAKDSPVTVLVQECRTLQAPITPYPPPTCHVAACCTLSLRDTASGLSSSASSPSAPAPPLAAPPPGPAPAAPPLPLAMLLPLARDRGAPGRLRPPPPPPAAASAATAWPPFDGGGRPPERAMSSGSALCDSMTCGRGRGGGGGCRISVSLPPNVPDARGGTGGGWGNEAAQNKFITPLIPSLTHLHMVRHYGELHHERHHVQVLDAWRSGVWKQAKQRDGASMQTWHVHICKPC